MSLLSFLRILIPLEEPPHLTADPLFAPKIQILRFIYQELELSGGGRSITITIMLSHLNTQTRNVREIEN